LCGRLTGAVTKVSQTFCDIPCPGDSSQMCGGSEFMSVHTKGVCKYTFP